MVEDPKLHGSPEPKSRPSSFDFSWNSACCPSSVKTSFHSVTLCLSLSED